LPGARSAETDTADPKALVARGYDQMALRYASWKVEGNPAMRFVRELDSRLRAGSDVIELGCGRGVPVARELAKRHRVTGVDISAAQIELARHHVPEASFVHADALELEVAPGMLDAVVALEVPRELLIERAVLRRQDKRTGQIYHLKYNPPPPGADLEHRADDQEDVVRKRLQAYADSTAAVIPHYEKQGIVRRVDGTKSMAEVTKLVFAALGVGE